MIILLQKKLLSNFSWECEKKQRQNVAKERKTQWRNFHVKIIPYLVVGRVEPSHREVLVRDDVGQPLRRGEEDVVGDVPDAGADHAQGDAGEDVRVVALEGENNVGIIRAILCHKVFLPNKMN